VISAVCPECGMTTVFQDRCWNPLCESYVKPPPPPPLPASVEAMISDDMAPTAPLDDFLGAYAHDDNLWWRIGCGHHMNLFDALLERVEVVDPDDHDDDDEDHD
jgi:hypothetical protein